MVWTLLLAKVSLWQKALSWSWDWLTSATRAVNAVPNLRRDEVMQSVSDHIPSDPAPLRSHDVVHLRSASFVAPRSTPAWYFQALSSVFSRPSEASSSFRLWERRTEQQDQSSSSGANSALCCPDPDLTHKVGPSYFLTPGPISVGFTGLQ